MKRRDFIRIMGSGGSVVLMPSLLSGCSSADLAALEPWKVTDNPNEDIRLRVLSYAILAPNAHNKQSWLIKLTGPASFELYVDRNRLLPETDPPARQVHISQGTFIELAELAAREFGYRAKIDYFPNGMYKNTVVKNVPVASFKLVEDASIKPDPLFKVVKTRISNKRPYSDMPVADNALSDLANAVGKGHGQLTLSNDENRRKRLMQIASEAMKIETMSEARDNETLAMFRFNDAEIEKYRDGFGIDQSGTSGFMKWMVETFFISREEAMTDREAWGKEAIKLTNSQAESATAWGWITTTSNSRKDQLLVGRHYVRVNLAATALGLAQHPMSQVLQYR